MESCRVRIVERRGGKSCHKDTISFLKSIVFLKDSSQIKPTNATFHCKRAKNNLFGQSKFNFSLGLLLILYCTFLIYKLSYFSKGSPFGIYCLTSPLVYSFSPLSQEE